MLECNVVSFLQINSKIAYSCCVFFHRSKIQGKSWLQFIIQIKSRNYISQATSTQKIDREIGVFSQQAVAGSTGNLHLQIKKDPIIFGFQRWRGWME